MIVAMTLVVQDIVTYNTHYLHGEGILVFQQLYQLKKLTAVAQILRVKATCLGVYRSRNHKDLECLLDEVSGTVGRQQLLEI